MPIKTISKIKLIDIIKLLLATSFIYLGLSYKVFDVWEKVSDFFEKDYLSESVEDHDSSLWNRIKSQDKKTNPSTGGNNSSASSHNIYQTKFDDLCKNNNSICSKVDFDWNYDIQYKYSYFSDSLSVLSWINSYIKIWENFLKSFNYLNLYQKSEKKRWYTRWNNVFINILSLSSDNELVQLLVHEFGHIVDLFTIKWYSKNKDKLFTEFEELVFPVDDPSIHYYKFSWESEKVRKSEAKPEDFCSGYGMFDPFEDFAECHNLYLNHNYIFRFFAISNSVMKKKYNFMANLYWWKYFDKNAEYLSQKNRDTKYRYWDTTRISY